MCMSVCVSIYAYEHTLKCMCVSVYVYIYIYIYVYIYIGGWRCLLLLYRHTHLTRRRAATFGRAQSLGWLMLDLALPPWLSYVMYVLYPTESSG